ncbi:MAG: S-methyl-5-thioribose-1-phosphate isomerase [Nitrospinae bacterium]|nr:S-methyl-5-thioribose-1-phosphate isomerase [Nitrospinota bacterium]
MKVQGVHYRTVWMEGPVVKMINQPPIPHRFEIVEMEHHERTAQAIQTMVVRGAGAIGATGGYGMAQVALEAPEKGFWEYIQRGAQTLRSTRPTAQNLFYAIDRVLAEIERHRDDPRLAREAAVAMAQTIADEDASACQRIGEYGEQLIRSGMHLSTHCNAGWLAFVDWGTALSPMYAAARQGKKVFVYVDETRPRCQGSRLTAWELGQEGIPYAIIADNATGYYMKTGQIEMVIVGSDRIAANGDVANKIGTYTKAVLARENGIPFYVAAPTTTIDPNCPSGDQIPIEERSQEEVLYAWGWSQRGEFERVRTSPEGGAARNPAFDVTPARYIQGIITEQGIVEASPEGIQKALGR